MTLANILMMVVLIDSFYASSLFDNFDYAVDALIVVMVLALWLEQTNTEGYKALLPALAALACMQMSAMCDLEEPSEAKMKDEIRTFREHFVSMTLITTYLPLIGFLLIEYLMQHGSLRKVQWGFMNALE